MKHKKTSLYEKHIELDAKVIPFAGYLMPVNYKEGISFEYNSVRNDVGMFDVSHMGKIIVSGQKSEDFLNYITANNIVKIKNNCAQYNMFCNHEGGVIDDIIVYKKNQNSFFIIVNASNIDKDYKWMIENNDFDVEIENCSEKTSILAIQGPNSRNIILKSLDINLDNLKFYTFSNYNLFNEDIIISRTGYTGELGYEIISSNSVVERIWSRFINNKVAPCGLGVRDILRIEMKYCLYGNDLLDSINPIQSGLNWVTDVSKKDFIGKMKIESEIKNPKKRLICFRMIDRAIPRSSYKVYVDNQLAGYVSSGAFSIGLNKGIGMAFLDYSFIKQKTIFIEIRNKFFEAEIIKPPFIKNFSLHS
ncbi:MAG: glycine cleavage system protein T [Candidatus Marinimicrobia bacterium]|nr:glycine cleavage system protein T [Candidatus Neomarinimicrobiota bacterium]|tara:strand:- start:28677 stop:29762 length:1086 start_codon:yes stop_codon:yes gene_type:complete